jgi:KDO2-lipid IV(A) lauroyltransferase
LKRGHLSLKLLDGATGVLARIPLRWLHSAARPMAWLLGVLPWSKHAVVERNLSVCFPERSLSERKRLAHEQLVEMLRLGSEVGALAGWPAERLIKHLPVVQGWEHVDSALSRGRGVLMVTGHLGNWEILNLELSRRISMVTLYRAPKSQVMDQFISKARSRFGGRVVASGSASMRDLLRQLKAGGAVGIAADIQPKQGEGVFAPFCGVPALTMTLVNRLARRTGCALILCKAIRLERASGWRLDFQPASAAVTDADPERAMRSINDWLTDSVRDKPSQYLWIYKRFSKRPNPGERFYPKG